MRLARKLFLLTAMAITAIAITAGTANAQEESVEVVNEVSGLHCDLGTANCEHHVVGSSSLSAYFLGVPLGVISACNDEFIATLDEDGSGFIYAGDYENDAATSQACTRIQCNDGAEANWDVENTGEYTGTQTDEGHLDVRFCLDDKEDPDGPGTHCTAEIQVDNHGNHHYGFTATEVHCPLDGGLEVRLNGEWESEATPHNSETEHEDDIEIIH